MDRTVIRQTILDGRAVLGIELSHTQIKTILVEDKENAPIAMGAFEWTMLPEKNASDFCPDRLCVGIREAFASLARDVQDKYAVHLTKLAAIALSSSIPELLPLDINGNLIGAPIVLSKELRKQKKEMLSEECGTHRIIFNDAKYANDLDLLTTPAGYIHMKLTGRKVLGAGEAARLFSPDSTNMFFDQSLIERIDPQAASEGYTRRLEDVLPEVLSTDDDAGVLTPDGASLLDPSGMLEPGALLAAPESSIGVELIAANSIGVGSGSILADDSIRTLIVLEHPLSGEYEGVEMTAAPDGKPVAIIHHENCSRDIDAWAGMLSGFTDAMGSVRSMKAIYAALFNAATNADPDCGGVINLNGRALGKMSIARPMMVYEPDERLTFANFARSLVYGTVATITRGISSFLSGEACRIDHFSGHGEFFKIGYGSQKLIASALNATVSVVRTNYADTVWGTALLAAFRVQRNEGQALEDYLREKVFPAIDIVVVEPELKDVEEFSRYLRHIDAAVENRIKNEPAQRESC